MKFFRKINIKDYELSKVQDAVATSLNSLTTVPFLDGVLLTGVAVATTDTLVSHTLGRNYIGYLVCQSNAAGSVFVSPTANPSPQLYINLQASAPATLTLWVF